MRQGASTWLNRGFLASSAVRHPWPELTRADQRHADTYCTMGEAKAASQYLPGQSAESGRCTGPRHQAQQRGAWHAH